MPIAAEETIQDLAAHLKATMALADKLGLPLVALKLSSAIDVLREEERDRPSPGATHNG
jgi:hypothetical protein